MDGELRMSMEDGDISYVRHTEPSEALEWLIYPHSLLGPNSAFLVREKGTQDPHRVGAEGEEISLEFNLQKI